VLTGTCLLPIGHVTAAPYQLIGTDYLCISAQPGTTKSFVSSRSAREMVVYQFGDDGEISI
jgi:hypothetical protein